MKQAELDAAVKVARDLFRTKMAEKGYSQFIENVESQIDLPDMMQYVLQAAEDARKTGEKKK